MENPSINDLTNQLDSASIDSNEEITSVINAAQIDHQLCVQKWDKCLIGKFIYDENMRRKAAEGHAKFMRGRNISSFQIIKAGKNIFIVRFVSWDELKWVLSEAPWRYLWILKPWNPYKENREWNSIFNSFGLL